MYYLILFAAFQLAITILLGSFLRVAYKDIEKIREVVQDHSRRISNVDGKATMRVYPPGSPLFITPGLDVSVCDAMYHLMHALGYRLVHKPGAAASASVEPIKPKEESDV